MSRLDRLAGLSQRAMLHALGAEPRSEAQRIRKARADRLYRAYWAERRALEAAVERRRAAYQKRRGVRA